MQWAVYPAVMLFVDREASKISTGVLFTLLFGLELLVQNLTNCELIWAKYYGFVDHHNLQLFIMMLSSIVLLLPGGSLTTTHAPKSGVHPHRHQCSSGCADAQLDHSNGSTNPKLQKMTPSLIWTEVITPVVTGPNTTLRNTL